MKIIQKLVLLSCTTLLLSGCNVDPKESTSSSSTTSTSEPGRDWTDDQKTLLKEYAGSVIPYPVSFTGEVYVEQYQDSQTSIKYLQIYTEATEFSIKDYYKSLEKSGWDIIRSYNNVVEQTATDGSEFYEAVTTSDDNKTGYDLIYYFYSSGDEEADPKYNIIQCFNYFDGEEDNKTSYSEEEQAVFKDTITEVAPLLKLGKTNAVTKYSADMAYIYDNLAKDNTANNADILIKNGYTLDMGLSESKDAYVLYKKLVGGQTIYASLYYSGGNNIVFSYQVDIQTSDTWPEEVVKAFKEESGFDVPSFSSSYYFYYTKKGVTTIYTYNSNAYTMLINYQMAMEKVAVIDNDYSWYTDWNETFFVKPQVNYDSSLGMSMFGISFGILDESYDTIVEGYPSDVVTKFLSDNNLTGTVPTFNFKEYSKYSTARVIVKNYEDAYKEIEAKVMEHVDWYVSDYTNEEAVKEYIASQAKANTSIKIKIYDEGIITDPENTYDKEYKVTDFIKETLDNAGWCRINNWMYEMTYENADGSILVGVQRYLDVLTLTITYGSGEKHTPRFEFETKSVSVAAGASYNLDLVVMMLPYEYTYTSSNTDIVTVDQSGRVSVASTAQGGEKVTITATMNVPGESSPRTATCVVTVKETFTKEKVINKVADAYNKYFNLASTDAKAAVPQMKGDDPDYISYNFTVETSFASEEEAMTFVDNNLVPAGFTTWYDTWDSDLVFDDSGDARNRAIDYNYHSDDWETFITLTFHVYTDTTTGKVMLKAIAN